MDNLNTVHFITKYADGMYKDCGSEILDIYVTPDPIVASWMDASAVDRFVMVCSHKQGLVGRRVEDIAATFIPKNKADREIAMSIVGRVVRCAISDGVLKEERRNQEVAYRQSVNGVHTRVTGAGIYGQSAEQWSVNAREAARASCRLGVGIHGLTPEQRSANSRRAGRATYEQKAGWFAMSPEARSALSRRIALRMAREGKGVVAMSEEEYSAAGVASARAQGKVVWEPDTVAQLRDLISDPQYHWTRGGRAGNIHWKKVHAAFCQNAGYEVSPNALKIAYDRHIRNPKT